MDYFTKQEKIAIFIITFIVIASLGFKFFIKDLLQPKDEIMNIGNESDIILEVEEDESKDESEAREVKEEIMVHISGQVYSPGLIILEPGKRLIDGIELAGGLKKEADLDRINLARKLADEEKIYIPGIGEEIDVDSGISSESLGLVGSEISSPGKVNINTCSKGDLISLPGIGEVIAGRIIEYRSNNPFQDIKDIKSVSGIGERKFEDIKELIKVR